jgi:hypothetical protein
LINPEIIENKLHEELVWKETGRNMEFDLFLSHERLAFEFRGIHHYQNIYSLGKLHHLQFRDQSKIEECNKHGITLIEVPYWWDCNPNSLIATIHKNRPELLSAPLGEPIPSYPLRFSKGKMTIFFI